MTSGVFIVAQEVDGLWERANLVLKTAFSDSNSITNLDISLHLTRCPRCRVEGFGG